MRRFFFFCVLALICGWAMAQSQYLTSQEFKEADRDADLLGASGVLIYSEHGDLVITLTNVNSPMMRRNGKAANGLYEYEVIIEPDETKQPKFEITRRGKVDRQSFLAKIKPDAYKAYKVSEVTNPIRLEDQTQRQDLIMDAKYAVVEIESSIQNLKVSYSDSLQAEVNVAPKKNDRLVHVTTLKFPIARLQEVDKRLQEALKEREVVFNRLTSPGAQIDAKDEKRYEELDSKVIPALESLRLQMNQIDVFAEGSNHLLIDITGIGPREKRRYGILLLVVEHHVSEYADLMTQGSRLLEKRSYEQAKTAFESALMAKDTPLDMVPVIKNNLSECDSCIRYDRYAKYAILTMQELKKKPTVSQEEVKEYASAALDFMTTLNNYNPCEYYELRIKKLQEMIEDMPLVINFTVSEWLRTVSGFHMGNKVKRVELWANFGFAHPILKDYNSERRFRKLIENDNVYQKVGETGEDGTFEVKLNRKMLPKGLFFHAPADEGFKVEYIPMQKILRDSKKDYKMRQYHLRMYKEND